MPFPLETPHLLIRPFTTADVRAAHRLYSDADAMRAHPHHRSSSLDETRRLLRSLILRHYLHGVSLWAITERASGRLIGDCGFLLEDREHFEVCFLCRLLPEHRTETYKKEAVRACLAYAEAVLSSSGFRVRSPENKQRRTPNAEL